MYQSSVIWDSIFNEFASDVQQNILGSTKEITLEKDASVFEEQHQAFGVYFVKKGIVKIYKTGKEGKSQIFQLCNNGDLFGFHPVLNDSLIYPDSARAVTHAVLGYIPKELFLDALKNSGPASFAMMRGMSLEFNNFIQQELFMAQKSVSQRVAIMLTEVEKIFQPGSGSNQGTLIELSRRDMADLCGTTKESLVRALTVFKEGGLIQTDGKVTEILNRNVLYNYC